MISMRTSGRPLVVAVSGPDALGKTTLVKELAQTLRRRGCAVATPHLYGCVVCRRLPPPRHWRDGPQPHHDAAGFLRRPLEAAHCLIDTTELSARLMVASVSLRRHRGRPTAIVTDRGPLDALAKFDPVPRSAAARRLTRLTRRYDTTVLLEGRPPVPEVLSRQRVPEVTDGWPGRYRRWARQVPSVVELEAGRDVSELVATAIGAIPEAAPTLVRRPRVVISNFDNTSQKEYAGGSAVSLERVARDLGDEFDVTIVTAGAHRRTHEEGGVLYRTLPVSWAGPRGGQLLFQAMLPFVARTVPHDLWLENLTPPFSAGLLPLTTRAPVIGIDKVRYSEFMRRKYHLPYRSAERFGYRRYRHLIVMNEADATAIRRLSPRTAVEVIPNGIDPPSAEPEPPYGSGPFPHDQGYILFLGRIDMWQKGLDLLLKAYARSGVTLPLILAGRGTAAQEKQLTKLVDGLPAPAEAGRGTGPTARLVGHVEGQRKHRLLQGSTFVVMPSRQETFGIVALEAMAYGKPVLHFDLPALRWTGGAGDVAVPAFDVDALAARMRELADDPAWRDRLGKQAAHLAEQYTAQAMSQRYRYLARRVLDASDSAAARTRQG